MSSTEEYSNTDCDCPTACDCHSGEVDYDMDDIYLRKYFETYARVYNVSLGFLKSEFSVEGELFNEFQDLVDIVVNEPSSIIFLDPNYTYYYRLLKETLYICKIIKYIPVSNKYYSKLARRFVKHDRKFIKEIPRTVDNYIEILAAAMNITGAMDTTEPGLLYKDIPSEIKSDTELMLELSKKTSLDMRFFKKHPKFTQTTTLYKMYENQLLYYFHPNMLEDIGSMIENTDTQFSGTKLLMNLIKNPNYKHGLPNLTKFKYSIIIKKIIERGLLKFIYINHRNHISREYYLLLHSIHSNEPEIIIKRADLDLLGNMYTSLCKTIIREKPELIPAVLGRLTLFSYPADDLVYFIIKHHPNYFPKLVVSLTPSGYSKICKVAVDKDHNNYKYLPSPSTPTHMELPDNHRELSKMIISKDYRNASLVHEWDEDLLEFAIDINYSVLSEILPAYLIKLNIRKFIWKRITEDPSLFKYIPLFWQTNELAKLAIYQDYSLLYYADHKLSEYNIICNHVIENSKGEFLEKAMHWVRFYLKRDSFLEDIIKNYLKNSSRPSIYFLQSLPEWVLYSLVDRVSITEEDALNIIKKNHLLYPYLENDYHENFFIKACEINSNCIKFTPKDSPNYEVLLKLSKTISIPFRFLDRTSISFEILLNSIKINPTILADVNEKYPNYHKLCKVAIKYDPRSFIHIKPSSVYHLKYYARSLRIIKQNPKEYPLDNLLFDYSKSESFLFRSLEQSNLKSFKKYKLSTEVVKYSTYLIKHLSSLLFCINKSTSKNVPILCIEFILKYMTIGDFLQETTRGDFLQETTKKRKIEAKSNPRKKQKK